MTGPKYLEKHQLTAVVNTVYHEISDMLAQVEHAHTAQDQSVILTNVLAMLIETVRIKYDSDGASIWDQGLETIRCRVRPQIQECFYPRRTPSPSQDTPASPKS